MNQVNFRGETPSAVAPETPLGSVLGELEAHLNDLGVTSEQLHHRLGGSVLRPDGNVAVMAAGSTKSAEQPRAQMSHTAERVMTITQRVRNITAQLQDALNRLEV